MCSVDEIAAATITERGPLCWTRTGSQSAQINRCRGLQKVIHQPIDLAGLVMVGPMTSAFEHLQFMITKIELSTVMPNPVF